MTIAGSYRRQCVRNCGGHQPVVEGTEGYCYMGAHGTNTKIWSDGDAFFGQIYTSGFAG